MAQPSSVTLTGDEIDSVLTLIEIAKFQVDNKSIVPPGLFNQFALFAQTKLLANYQPGTENVPGFVSFNDRVKKIRKEMELRVREREVYQRFQTLKEGSMTVAAAVNAYASRPEKSKVAKEDLEKVDEEIGKLAEELSKGKKRKAGEVDA